MHHNRIQADQLEQHDVMGKTALQHFFGHRIATVFDDDGFAVILLDIRQAFGQDFGDNVGGHGFSLASHGRSQGEG